MTNIGVKHSQVQNLEVFWAFWTHQTAQNGANFWHTKPCFSVILRENEHLKSLDVTFTIGELDFTAIEKVFWKTQNMCFSRNQHTRFVFLNSERWVFTFLYWKSKKQKILENHLESLTVLGTSKFEFDLLLQKLWFSRSYMNFQNRSAETIFGGSV